jgi:TRAP-type C4-dicarboxylate transport system substrate-binding protein
MKAVALGITAIVALTSCGASSGDANSDGGAIEELRAIGTLPIGSYGSEALELFKESVEGSTSGSVLIETFPAGQLYNDKDAAEAIPSGAADIGVVQMDFWTGKSPLLGALYIPMIYDDKEHFYAARAAMTEILDEELQGTANVKVVGWFNLTSQTIATSTQVSSSDDFSGQKLRGWGEYSSGFLQAAGADAVVMSSTEVYDGIQKGTIDGTMSAWGSMVDRSFYEVAPFMIDMSLQPSTAYAVVVNLDVWDRLSAEQQTALEAAGAEMDTWSDAEMETVTADSITALEAEGVTITTIEGDAFRQLRDDTVPELKERYLTNTNGEGAPLLDIIEDTRG